MEDRRNAVLRFVPLWVVAAAGAALLIGAYILFSTSLNTRAEPVNSTIAQAGLDAAYAAAPTTATAAHAAGTGAPSSGLKRALAEPIALGLLEVEEAGDKTRVTLVSTDLFGSGSAQVNPRYVALLHEIATTLERLPGRILVIGHTDNRPIRSLQYKDNYELSRDRAQHVADLIRPNLTNPARLDATGVGPSKPRYLPEDEPANQARNRRVEVVYRRED